MAIVRTSWIAPASLGFPSSSSFFESDDRVERAFLPWSTYSQYKELGLFTVDSAMVRQEARDFGPARAQPALMPTFLVAFSISRTRVWKLFAAIVE